MSERSKELVIDCLNPTVKSDSAVLLLHGWGASSCVWSECSELLAETFALYSVDLPGHGKHANLIAMTISEFIEQLASNMPVNKFSIIGWSLGGLVGSLLAAKCSDRVTALVTIATNQNFLTRTAWPSALTPTVFESFYAALSASTMTRQVTRFQALQAQGVDSAKQDCRRLKSSVSDADFSLEGLQLGLIALRDNDLYDCWQALSMPVMHQFGRYDVLIPVSACRAIAQIHPHHSYRIFRQSAHLPFLTEATQWQLDTEQFLRSALKPQVIDKKAIADSFSKAANHYDAVAQFQRQTGAELLQLMPDKSIDRLADLGSGTGFFSAALRDIYPLADIIEVDISRQMLVYARQHRFSVSPEKKLLINSDQIQSDIEHLPFQAVSLDMIFSNLAIQWCANLDGLFAQLASSLVGGGQAFLSTLIEGSLFELKFAWSMADAGVHVNRFSSLDALKASCERAGLTINICYVADKVQYFNDLPSLLRSVKKIGAHNMNPLRSKGLLGKQKYQQFVDAYQGFKTNQQQFPLTYRVAFLAVEKPA